MLQEYFMYTRQKRFSKQNLKFRRRIYYLLRKCHLNFILGKFKVIFFLGIIFTLVDTF